MRLTILLLAAAIGLGQIAAPASAQQAHKKPKSEVTKIRKARKKHRAARQVLPDPKKSPGKHADNLSKNANHEVNRESKDINHTFQSKKKKK